VRMKLKMDYCKTCGDCCLADCKSSDGECHEDNSFKKYTCDMYPLFEVNKKFYFNVCNGIIRGELPLSDIKEIIKRLDNGERNFEVRKESLYFQCFD
jgi:hypothetical protein